MRVAILAGIIFAVLDVLPMFGMEFPDKTAAIAGAFLNRFAIGFLIPLVALPGPAWAAGIMMGILLSAPYAIITTAWLPIMTTGIVGGAIIGAITGRRKRAA